MGSVRIIADSGCDLEPPYTTDHQIDVVPLSIRFGDRSYIDRVELSYEEFWEKCHASATLPATAAPSPGAFEAAIARAADDGCSGAIIVTMSEKLSSGTVASAHLAAAEHGTGLPVEVVDSGSAGPITGAVVLAAARAAEAGSDLAGCVQAARWTADNVWWLGALDTLENLRKGGRIGRAAAALGGLLSIKPLINTVDGEVVDQGKVRTRSRSIDALLKKVESSGEVEYLYVIHANAPDLDAFLNRLNSIYPRDKVEIMRLGPVVGTHVGERALGVVGVPSLA